MWKITAEAMRMNNILSFRITPVLEGIKRTVQKFNEVLSILFFYGFLC
jgi:hypothetical protein